MPHPSMARRTLPERSAGRLFHASFVVVAERARMEGRWGAGNGCFQGQVPGLRVNRCKLRLVLEQRARDPVREIVGGRAGAAPPPPARSPPPAGRPPGARVLGPGRGGGGGRPPARPWAPPPGGWAPPLEARRSRV